MISELEREVHLMKATLASGCCLPCLPCPTALLEGLTEPQPNRSPPHHSKNPFTLQKVFLGLGLPQAEELPTLLAYVELLLLEGSQGCIYPQEGDVPSGPAQPWGGYFPCLGWQG